MILRLSDFQIIEVISTPEFSIGNASFLKMLNPTEEKGQFSFRQIQISEQNGPLSDLGQTKKLPSGHLNAETRSFSKHSPALIGAVLHSKLMEELKAKLQLKSLATQDLAIAKANSKSPSWELFRTSLSIQVNPNEPELSEPVKTYPSEDFFLDLDEDEHCLTPILLPVSDQTDRLIDVDFFIPKPVTDVEISSRHELIDFNHHPMVIDWLSMDLQSIDKTPTLIPKSSHDSVCNKTTVDRSNTGFKEQSVYPREIDPITASVKTSNVKRPRTRRHRLSIRALAFAKIIQNDPRRVVRLIGLKKASQILHMAVIKALKHLEMPEALVLKQ